MKFGVVRWLRRKLQRKKTGTLCIEQVTPLQRGRIHKPVIDKEIMQMVYSSFRSRFIEN